jgi:hypothetical protein
MYQKYFTVPGTTVTLIVGDLFDQEGNLVIGMNDTFDTEIPVLIKPGTVQGQLLQRQYSGDRNRLDRDLDKALNGIPVVANETNEVNLLGRGGATK